MASFRLPSPRSTFTTSLFVLAMACLILTSRPAAAIETVAREAVLMDAATGTWLFNKNGDSPMAAASMSKMMTVYLIFERLRDSRLSLDDSFVVSEKAWRKGGAKSGSSTMFLEPGARVKTEDLLRGIIVQSGNDACIVMAEGLAGSEAAFAEEMTRRAREIGMTQTIFKNSTGWPDPEHVTSAKDLAILAQRTIRDFPNYYHYYSERSFTYNGIRQFNRNPLLSRSAQADGLKTGYTEESGYGLTASMMRGNRRLIVVMNGLPSKKARRREPQRLLEWGFREFNNYSLFKAGEQVTDASVWLGKEHSVPLIIENELTLTLPRKTRRNMKVEVRFDGPIPSPITKGDKLATLVVTAPDLKPVEFPLLAGKDVERLGLFGRLGAALRYILWGDSAG